MIATTPMSPLDQRWPPVSGAFNRLAPASVLEAEVGGKKQGIVSPQAGNHYYRLKYQF